MKNNSEEISGFEWVATLLVGVVLGVFISCYGV